MHIYCSTENGKNSKISKRKYNNLKTKYQNSKHLNQFKLKRKIIKYMCHVKLFVFQSKYFYTPL